MAVFCIPRHLVDKLKNSALKGEVDIAKLYKMTSTERRNFFIKYTDRQTGRFINTEFEKAMVSKQKTALKDWAESVFSPREKRKTAYKTVLDKINSLDAEGILDPKSAEAFLEDLVADKLGVTVTPEEVAIISEKAKVIAEAQTKLGTDLGNPAKLKENMDFFKAKKDMDDYLASRAPAPILRILTGTIGRGMMLFSIKSPILNIGSNVEVGLAEALSRRLSGSGVKSTDAQLARSYIKMVNKIYQKTGYDLSRMTSLRDTGASGERVLGQTVHSQGKGKTRKVGRFIEDVVFKQLMGAPDVAFSSAHFADSVNMNAMRMAKGNKALAKEYMSDAMRIEPKTSQGELLRQQGILDAQRATWTDTTWASRVSEGIRSILNEVSGDFRAGDYLLPFIKTPANVIATGMDYAGMGIPKALYKTAKAMRSGELGSKEYFQSISMDLVRSGLGITGAIIIQAWLDDDDFVGAYDPQRAQIESLRNSNYNAIRVGGKWISTDWLGPLAVPVTAMMYARKYGNNGGERTFQYSKAVLASSLSIPGVADVYDYVRANAYKKNQSLEEMTGETQDYLTSEAYSRLIPSLSTDIAKGLDKYVRQGGKGLTGVMAKIPGVSQILPEKRTILGDKVEGESFISDILFGSRVKTDREDDLTKEIVRVADSVGKGISFTDWDKSISKKLAQFKDEVGVETYNEAKIEYGQLLKEKLIELVESYDYEEMTDEDKHSAIIALDTDAMMEIFDSYGFTYQQEED
jgi:hypothetical protein